MKRFVAVLCLCALLFLTFGCNEKTYTFIVPDGAPALAVSKYICDKEDFGLKGLTYSVVSSNDVGLSIQKKEGDIVIAPINVASKLYRSCGYKTAGIITHGNLYIISKEEIALNDLKGKVVGVIGQGLIPDLTFKSVLKEKGLEYANGDTPISGKVALRYFSSASEVIPLLKNGIISVGLLPEPAVTKLSSISPEYSFRLDLQELYDGEEKAYPQAVLMVKESFYNEHSEVVKKIKETFDGNVLWLKDNISVAIDGINSNLKAGLTPSLTAQTVNGSVIDGCKIFWQSAKDGFSEITEYINKIREIENKSANPVGEDFYIDL